MLVDIQTFVLDTGGNTQAVDLLDSKEEDDTAGSSPEVDHQNTEALSSEEAPAVTIERTVAGREQTCEQCTQDTTDTMNRACTYRVVDVQYMINELDREYQDGTADKTDNNSTQG